MRQSISTTRRAGSTIYADGSYAVYGYDGLGRKAWQAEQLSSTVAMPDLVADPTDFVTFLQTYATDYTYDALGRLAAVAQPTVTDPSTSQLVQPMTTYGYDGLGRMTSQQDANLHTTLFGYDVFGRRTSRTLPDGTNTESWTYDNDGNMLTHTDYNHHTTTDTYDYQNRLKTQTPDAYFTAQGESAVSYTYYASGAVHTMTDGTGTTTYTYDARGRLKSEATPEGTLSYTYPDTSTSTVSSDHTGGENVTYTYDDQGRLWTVTDLTQPSGQQVTTYAYTDTGMLHSVTHTNGVTDTYTYDSLSRLTDLVTADSGGTILSAYHYQYHDDHSANRTDEWDNLLDAGDPDAFSTGRHVQYTYDHLDRLLSETISGDTSGPNGTISYTYDLVGNRLTRTATGDVSSTISNQSFTYDADDRLISDTYDANGNTIDDGTHTYTYDSLNRLIKEILDATQAVVATFTYDGAGNRVSETTDSGTTLFLVDSNNPTGYSQVVEELQDDAGALNVTREYTYGLTVLTESQSINGTWTTSTYGQDGHGNMRILTSTSGQLTDTVTYEAYGTILHQTGTTPNDILYSGQRYDASLGMYYNRARYLNVDVGRFWTVDTYEGNEFQPFSLNDYVFADANPSNRVDPK